MNLSAKELMERQHLQHRQTLLRFVGITLGVFFAIYGVNHWRKPQKVETPIGENDWVYIRQPKDAAERGKLESSLKDYLGRPGMVVSAPDNAHFKVKFDLESKARKQFSDEEERKKNEAEVPVPREWLAKCPPGQEGVDSWFEGVMRVWKGTEATPLEKQTLREGKLGEKVTMEVKNFDRWLFVQMDYGRFKEDINDLPPEFQKYVERVVAARRSVRFFQAINHVNQLLKGEMKDPKKSEKAWQTLKSMIEQNAILSEIVEGSRETGGDPTKPAIDWTAKDSETDKARERELLKLERQIGPLKVWFMNFTRKRYEQLTLTLNGVVLRGLTPRNAYNEAEVLSAQRPSFRDDTYQWVRFDLERRVVEGDAGDAKAEDAAHAAAWSRLLGRPKLKEPMKVTLSLPESGLELQTKVTPDAEDECRFYLIGIRAEVLYATLAVFVCLLGFLGWLARTTDILRDSSGPIRPDGVEPVSLAKTQMAFWFILNASAFAFLWVTTGNIDTINKTCLVLLGIGTGTALGAALIPSTGSGGKSGRNYLVETSLFHTCGEVSGEIRRAIVERVRQLWLLTKETETDGRKEMLALLRKAASQDQFSALVTELQLDAGEPAAEVKSNEAVVGAIARVVRELRKIEVSSEMETLIGELELLGKQLKDFEGMAQTVWKRLFADLLSESPSGGSYEFHRFQMLGWTLLLGLVFLVKLLNDRAMPEFGDTTLALLGISGGTYLGFKLPAVKGGKAAEEK